MMMAVTAKPRLRIASTMRRSNLSESRPTGIWKAKAAQHGNEHKQRDGLSCGALILHPRRNEGIEGTTDEPAHGAANHGNRRGSREHTIGKHRRRGAYPGRLGSRRGNHDQCHSEQCDDHIERCCRPDIRSCNQKLAEGKRQESADHVDRKDSSAFGWHGLCGQPALCRDKNPGTSEANDRAQAHPGERTDQERHQGNGGSDQAGKCGVSPNVTDPFDDSAADQRTQGEAGEIGAEHQAGDVEALDGHSQ